MFVGLACRIAEGMVKRGSIRYEDRDIYIFGISQGFATLVNTATAIAIGLLLGIFWQIIIFMVCYIVIRQYAGGYHAPTPFRCFVTTTLFVVAAALVIRYVSIPVRLIELLVLVGGLATMYYSPVDNRNKPLDGKEHELYKKRAVLLSFAVVFAALIIVHLDYFVAQQIAVSIMCALVILAIMVLLGMWDNRKEWRNEREKAQAKPE